MGKCWNVTNHMMESMSQAMFNVFELGRSVGMRQHHMMELLPHALTCLYRHCNIGMGQNHMMESCQSKFVCVNWGLRDISM